MNTERKAQRIDDLVAPEALEQLDNLISKLSIASKLSCKIDLEVLKVQALTELLNVEHLHPGLRNSTQDKLKKLVDNF